MAVLLWRVLECIRPREGWLAFVLAATALLSVGLGVQETRWVQGGGFRSFFVVVALIGGGVGLLLARSRLAGRAATVVAGLGGAAFVVNAVGRVLPPWARLAAEFDYLGQWLRRGWTTGEWMESPFQPLLSASGQRLAFLARRLVEWWSVVRAGETSGDDAPLLLLAGLVIWAAAVFAVWGIYRWRRPLIGLLPGGAILALSHYYSGEGLLYLLAFLAGGTFLVPWVHFIVLVESWERRGVDYSPEVRFDMGLLGFAVAVVVVIAGMLLPSVSVRQVTRWAGEHWPDAWRISDEEVQRVFGVSGPRAGGEGAGAGRGSLPRAHLLGGGVDLTRQPVMTVTTDDLPTLAPGDWDAEQSYRAPRYYWRMLTYDRYTGRGWENTALETTHHKAGQSLPRIDAQGRRELWQKVSLFASYEGVVYAAGDPVWLDAPYRAHWRAPGDLAGLETQAQQYTVVSLLPAATERALRQSPAGDAAEIGEQYWQLPDDVPQRVLALARRVTANASTPYDAALALQTYLRQFDYSLQLAPPPPDRDVVDYFLFDVQTGYCDYYASAMVVMARAVGLPARLAIGYASGAFDFDRGHYYVVEADAHSWPEVYLAGYGWIEFEPTAARSPFEREDAGPPASLPSPPPPLPPRSLSASVKRLLAGRGGQVGMGVCLAGLALWLAWSRWLRLAWLPGPALMATIYRRLARQGARLGAPLRPSDTPGEYCHNLTQTVTRRAARLRPWQEWLSGHAQRAAVGLATVERLYLEATYSRHPLNEWKRRAALDAWRGLSLRLWLLWLGGKPTQGIDSDESL